MNKECAGLAHLEHKIEYLNSLYIQTKELNEQKEGVIKDLTIKNEELNTQLKAIIEEKERTDNDLQELVEEFALVKDKYENSINSIKERDRQIADLKKKTGAKETPLKQIPEPEHIPELNEEIEELKEKLEQKEKVIGQLKGHIESLSVDNTMMVNNNTLLALVFKG